MPGYHPDSSDSQPPSATPYRGPDDELPDGRAFGWKTNAALFVLTVASVFVTSFFERSPTDTTRLAVIHAIQFTCTLLAILLAHELAHFAAARAHGVPASLPYFVPMPFLSPFGTMGAVIAVPSAIPTRRALLDFGAAGPLAGLALAIPLYAFGVAHSTVGPADTDGWMQLGDSLLSRGLERLFAPPTPEGTTLFLSPVALAAWAGMFVTMVNLFPVGQLDGGHVAYALFGKRQNRVATWVHRSMLAFFAVSVVSFAGRDLRAGLHLWHMGHHVQSSLFWLVWFEVVAVIGQLTSEEQEEGARLGVRTRAIMTALLLGTAWLLLEHDSFFLWAALGVALVLLTTMEARWGALRADSHLVDHPPAEEGSLSWPRMAIGVITLIFFALLFMPTPFVF